MVMWKLKPEAVSTKEIADANIEKQMERFRNLKSRVPEIKQLKVFRSFNTGDNFYDFVVIMDFNSREDLQKFQISTAHRDPEGRKFVDLIRESKAVVDYEVD
jgi:hypothetical protein